MPMVKNLADPREGSIPRGETEWWNRQIEGSNTEEQKSIYTHNREFLSSTAKLFAAECYASCWHQNEFENYAMWQCYTRGSNSIAIKTTHRALKESIPEYVNVGMVRYIDYAREERLPSMNAFESVMHKDIFFKYEQEIRVIAFPISEGEHNENNLFELISKPGFRVYSAKVNLSQLIHNIVIHPDSDIRFREGVEEICNKFGLPEPEESRANSDNAF